MKLTAAQQQALSTLGLENGEVSELSLYHAGLNLPRVTMVSLEKRGLVVRGRYINEEIGYMWHSPKPWFQEQRLVAS
jgi:hypothetical protein